MITNENFTTLMPHYNRMFGSGVQVLVFEKDFEKASSIIHLPESSIAVCPFCGSSRIKYGLGRTRANKLVAILMSLFAFIPFNNIGNTYHCSDCNADFNR